MFNVNTKIQQVRRTLLRTVWLKKSTIVLYLYMLINEMSVPKYLRSE